MQRLATQSVPIGLSSRPFAFVASAAEFQKATTDFDGEFILWADTENVLTRSAPAGQLITRTVALSTAFTIVKKSKGDNDYAARDLVIDECESLAWQFLLKIHELTEAGNACPPEIYMLDETSISVDRDGPYYNEHYGATAQLTLHIFNGIPEPDRDLWAS